MMVSATSLVNKIFDRRQVRRLREKCVSLTPPYDFLHRDLEQKLCKRAEELGKNFSKILVIGSKTSQFENFFKQRAVFFDFAARPLSPFSVIGDEEALPFSEGCFDLIISSAHLHHVNDVKRMLADCHRVLAPRGVILGCVVGEMSLAELRRDFIQYEMDWGLGNVPRISPMLELKTMAQLLGISGFQDIVCDLESYDLEYSSLRQFAVDLKNMGETNVLAERQKSFPSPQLKKIFEDLVPIHLEYIFFAGFKNQF